MASKRSMGCSEYMKKKVPRNPKYQYVKPKVDTGCSLIKYMERMEELKKNYRYRKGELFKRLKVSTFAQLVIQVASVSDLNDMAMEQDLDDMWAVPPVDNMSVLLDVEMGHNNSPQDMAEHIIDEDSDSEPESSRRSTLQSLITGVGELDMEHLGQKRSKPAAMSRPRGNEYPYPDCPYLLLDVRDQEDYERCHIISAYSFPITNLARTMDPYIKELLEYKNAPGKIIILYDEDERIASVAATTLFERGFENVFMLSGGLRVIAQKFPEGMTTGTFPAQCRMSPMATRSLTRAPPLLDFQPAERKWRFTFEDIRNIQQHQEELLVPSASKSQLTITSKSSSLSKSSSTRSQRAPSVGGTDGSRSQRAPSVGGTDGCRPQSGRPWR